jgi:hypothetical protein
MKRLRLRTAIFGGAVVGIVAAVSVYGAVATSVVTTKPAVYKAGQAPRGAAPPSGPAARAGAAPCAGGESLENGVCIVYEERTEVVPGSVAEPPVAAAGSSRAAAASVPATYHPRKAISQRRAATASQAAFNPRASSSPQSSPRSEPSLLRTATAYARTPSMSAAPVTRPAAHVKHATDRDDGQSNDLPERRDKAAKQQAAERQHRALEQARARARHSGDDGDEHSRDHTSRDHHGDDGSKGDD